jgi:hypothetical protein
MGCHPAITRINTAQMARTQSMTCDEFIALASDGIEQAGCREELDAFQQHRAACISCARYHRVLARGLDLVRELPEIEPSADFTWRLHRRLRGLDDEMAERQRSVTSGVVVVLAVAGMVAFTAWSPLLGPAPTASAARTAAPLQFDMKGAVSPVAADPVPEASMDWLFGSAAAAYVRPWRAPGAAATFPGPYSPLVVQPPATGRPGRNVLTSLAENE